MIGSSPRLRLDGAPDQYRHLLRSLIAGAWERSGEDVSALEVAVAKRFQVRHAVAVPRARTGIYVVLKALIRPGQKVILSPYTVTEVVNAVVCAGGIPVFADIDRTTCNIRRDEILRIIDRQTGAVLVTHFYGLMADVEAIAADCKERDIPLVEDAAQAFDARIGGRYAGAFGAAGIFSFGLHKTINSFFGGMVITDSDALAAKLRAATTQLPLQPIAPFLGQVGYAALTELATWPPIFRIWTFWIFRWAFLHNVSPITRLLQFDLDAQLRSTMPNAFLCRMRPVQARLIIKQLDAVAKHTAQRIESARAYHEGLRDIPELLLPPFRENGSHLYWYYPIQYADRRALVRYLMRHGRDIAMSSHRNCAAIPCFAPWARSCPEAEAAARSVIYLPTYPRYHADEVRKTIEVIRRYFRI